MKEFASKPQSTPVEEKKGPSSKQEPQRSKENPEEKEKVARSAGVLADKLEEEKEGKVYDVAKSAPTAKVTSEQKNRTTPGRPKNAESDGEASSSEYEMDWVSNEEKKPMQSDKSKEIDQRVEQMPSPKAAPQAEDKVEIPV